MKFKSFFFVLLGLSIASTRSVRADDAAMLAAPTNATESVATAPESTNAVDAATNAIVVTNSVAAATNPPATNIIVVLPPPESNAVVVAAAPDETTNSLILAPAAPAYRRWTAGVEAGTLGAGPEVRWHISDLVGIGAAYDRLSFTYSGTIQDNLYHGRARMSSVPITADFYPLHNDDFHVSAGVLLNWNRFSGSTSGTVDLNGTPYVGTANLMVKQRFVDPYIAVGGNYYFTKKRHLSLGGEFGLAYTGVPRVSLTLNPPNGAVETQRQQEEDKIRHDLHWAQLWPVLKVSLNYSF